MLDTSLEWDTIYSVPPTERGSFWTWINAKEQNRVLHCEGLGKADELGLVAGFKTPLYEEWRERWSGKLAIPSHRYNNKSYTVFDCDKELLDDKGLRDDFDVDLFEIKHSLIEFMLHPYRHDVFYLTNEKPFYWYDIENELHIAHTLLLKNPNSKQLFYSLQQRAKELTNLILGKYYGYKNSFKQ